MAVRMKKPLETPWPVKPGSDPDALGIRSGLTPLFHAAWLFACGIALAHFIWFRPSLLLVAMAPLAALSCITAFRTQRILWAPLTVLWLMLGAWCAEMQPQPAPAPQIAALSDGLLRAVEGTVIDAGPIRDQSVANADAPGDEGASQRVDVRVSSIEVVDDTRDEQQPAAGGVRLTLRWPADAAAAPIVHCGDRVRALVQLHPPEQFRDAGVWSRADYLLDQGMTSMATARPERVEVLPRESAHTWEERRQQAACWTAALQHNMSARILALPAAMQGWPAALRIGPDDAVMLAAMVTGDRTWLTRTLRAGFERTGSFHMLVVAGFHLAVVAACLMWLARKARVPHVPATLLTLAGSFAYALLTGFAAPVERSFWMVALYLVGRLFDRRRNPLNVIGFAVLCLLAASPRVLFDSGFQMTALAVVSIAGVAAPLLAHSVHPWLRATRELREVAIDIKAEPKYAAFRVMLRIVAERMERIFFRGCGWNVLPWTLRFALRCVELVVVSLVVELAMSLPMAIYFHRITVFALPVNLLILPLLSILLPVALLMLALLVIWPAAAVVPAAATALLLHAGVDMVHLFGGFSLGDLRMPGPLAWQMGAFCALLAAAVALAAGKRAERRAAWVALLLAAVAVVIPRPLEHPHDALLVEALDVGQGDSILVITPDGKTLLVDAGGIGGGYASADVLHAFGEDVVSAALWARGIRRLDAVALTHAHSDHMGGMPAVLENFRPRVLWVGSNPAVPAYEQLLDEAARLHIAQRTLRAGDALTLGDAAVQVFAPASGYQPGSAPANNDSLVLRVAVGRSSVLLEGDAEAGVEHAMLGETGLQSTLLKVGHHGSKTSTTPEFLAAVSPQWAVISCGLRNRFGHPRQEILEELQTAHVRTYSTDIQGAVCFALRENDVQAEPLCGMSELR